MIDQLFEHLRIELLFAHQIDQNAGIEIAAARAHDHPAGRGQAHAGVDRLARFDRGDAGAIAEMGDDQPVSADRPPADARSTRRKARETRSAGCPAIAIPWRSAAPARPRASRRERRCRSTPTCGSPGKCSRAKRMTAKAAGVCSGAKAAAASSCRSTASSIRQCCRSCGPPCTMRCPTAAGRRHPALGQKPPDADDRFALARNGRRLGELGLPPRIRA